MSNEYLGVVATIDKAIRTRTLQGLAQLLPNPDPILKKQNRDIATYREIERDPTVVTAFQSRVAKVLKMDWAINADKAKTEQSEFIRKMFESIALKRIMKEMMLGVKFGYQPLEMYYRRSGDFIEVKDIVAKPPEWFAADSNKQWRLMTSASTSGKPLPNRKVYVMQHEASYTNPYGVGKLSEVFWAVTFKKGGLKLYMKFLDKYGLPYLHGKVRRNAEQEDIDEMYEYLEELRQDGIVVTEEDANINIVDASSAKSADLFKSLREDMRADIIEPIVGHRSVVELTPGKLGSEDTALEVLESITEQDAAYICDAFNDIIRWVIDYNFFVVTDYPTFSLHPKNGLNKNRADRDAVLSEKMGVRFKKTYFIRYYDLKDDEFEVVDVSAAAPTAAFEENPDGDTSPAPEQQAIDEVVEQLSVSELTKNAVQEMLTPIIDLIDSGASLEELEQKAAQIFPLMNSKEIESLIAQAIFTASTLGRATALQP